jgi:hypothetical protein
MLMVCKAGSRFLKNMKKIPPAFHHHPASSLPEWKQAGVTFKLVAGSAYGYEAPVTVYSPMFYVEVKMQAGRRLKLPMQHRERAIYSIEGGLRIGDTHIAPLTMTVFEQKEAISLEAEIPTHLMLLGGKIGVLLNRNFDLRRSILKISDGNLQMVEAARSVAASANFTGSGGAIIGTYTDDAMYECLKTTLSVIGMKVIKPEIVPMAD